MACRWGFLCHLALISVLLLILFSQLLYDDLIYDHEKFHLAFSEYPANKSNWWTIHSQVMCVIYLFYFFFNDIFGKVPLSLLPYLSYEVHHFYCSHRTVEALVSCLCSGSFNCLLDVFCCEHAEHNGNSCL